MFHQTQGFVDWSRITKFRLARQKVSQPPPGIPIPWWGVTRWFYLHPSPSCVYTVRGTESSAAPLTCHVNNSPDSCAIPALFYPSHYLCDLFNVRKHFYTMLLIFCNKNVNLIYIYIYSLEFSKRST